MPDRGSLSGPGWATNLCMPSGSRPARTMTLPGDRGSSTTCGRATSDHGDGALCMLQSRAGDRPKEQLGKAATTATEHEQLGPCGLLDECSAHVVVVADQFDLQLDLGEAVTLGLERPAEMFALDRLHPVHPGHEPRIAPHGRGPNPHGGQPHLPARCSLESKSDGRCRQMREIHTYDNPSGGGPEIGVGARGDDNEWACSMSRQVNAHRHP